jgi:serine/threonine protein phosphatase PrpC
LIMVLSLLWTRLREREHMSAQRILPELRRVNGRFAFFMLGGLLLVFQLILAPVALAASSSRGNTDPPQAMALSEVSVVRLVSAYTAKTATRGSPSSILCTSLGVLVKSWPANPGTPTSTDFNSWVLTASSASTTSTPCGLANVIGKPATVYTLSKIDVYANTAYTAHAVGIVLLGTYRAVASNPVVCSIPSCSGGAALFGFHTNQPQPTLDGATTDLTQQFGIGLTNGTSPTTLPPVPVPSAAVAQQFLDPTAVSLAATSTPPEVGMPFLNAQGQFVAMRLQGTTPFTAAEYQGFVAQGALFTNAPPNPLQVAWENGIKAYYARNYPAAITSFQQVESLNPDLMAATLFKTEASAQLSNSQGSQQSSSIENSATSSANNSWFGIPRSTIFIIGVIAGFILLIVLLIMVSMWARRKRELAHFEKERAEAQRNADREVQQMQKPKATAQLPRPSTELPCPNCGTLVRTTAAFCPHCRYLLAASASGLHLQATPPPTAASQAQVNNIPPSPLPASAISDMPTMEFAPANGNESAEHDTTLPYSIEEIKSQNLSLSVGYLTDPGIKRKHRPNEDSLLVMKGARTNNALPQEFGLFVVADGMGGHANGQDASRLAIQTIVNFILPKLSASYQMDDNAFSNLMRDGVQQANEAVHQRNIEERADMGTTMTASLVVGPVAYVANVGDSRTYLYRQPQGLVKITHDHSVVASLVEAGIIKPDDIYTHPKRNQIYRSLGEKPAVDVDAFRVSLQEGDKLLLCSDGLWDMVRDPEIERLMSAPVPDPTMTGKNLIKAALDGGGEDNVSVIVVAFSDAETSISSQSTMPDIQLLYKPETVTVPDLSKM